MDFETAAADSATKTPSILAEIFDGIVAAQRAVQRITPIYPLYLASRIKDALIGVDPENIIDTDRGIEIETVGDCRYALRLFDTNGTEYEITVKVRDKAARQ